MVNYLIENWKDSYRQIIIDSLFLSLAEIWRNNNKKNLVKFVFSTFVC